MNKEYLIKEYIINRKSSIEIGNIFNCTKENVLYWLHKYKIKIRDKSLNSRLGHKKRKRKLFYKNCIVCTNKFVTCPSQNRKYCSRKCYDITRNRSWTIPIEKRRFGSKSHKYIDGRTKLHILIRELNEYKIWRKSIFERDNYICQECFNKGGNLEAHHYKIPFRQILKNFLNYYNQFSPMEDKETLIRLTFTWQDFWDINNGKTYCKKCHGKIDKYRAKSKLLDKL